MALVNMAFGSTITLLLSSLASLLLDRLDNASALVFVAPGICQSVKSYSDNSWNSLATLWLIFCGSFQYCRLEWSVWIII